MTQGPRLVSVRKITPSVPVGEAKARMIASQWGVISVWEWMRLEADRLTAAGSPARRIVELGRVSIVARR
jgi:hypothetical protein